MTGPDDDAQGDAALLATTAGGRDAPARTKPRDLEVVGRFQVLRLLGEGATGEVFLAVDPNLGRRVAIKMVHRGDDDSADGQLPLLREAQASARLSHDHVIVVHEVGVRDGRVYLAMEYVAGTTLRSWQAGRGWREILSMYRCAGEGLQAAHDAGVVHRDFKPENVLVGDDGRVRVTDFGLVGTPRHRAPEQLRGEADARADQFAFCGALSEAWATADVPAALRDAAARGLRPARDDRFPSMQALLDALVEPAAPPTPRRRWLAPAAALAAVAMIAVAAYLWSRPAADSQDARIDRALARARLAAVMHLDDAAHARYLEAEAVRPDIAIVEEHTRFLGERGRLRPAVDVTKAYSDARPDDVRGLLLHGQLLLAAGDWRDAADVATRLLKLEPDSAAGHGLRGRAQKLDGELDAAIADLRRAVELAPGAGDVGHLTELAEALLRARRGEEAALTARAAIDRDPSSARAMRVLGEVARESFEVAESVTWLQQATASDPSDAETWFQLALSQSQVGDLAAAEASAAQATRIDPENSRYWYVHGETLRLTGKRDQAVAAYRKALEVEPPHPKAQAKLASALYDAGQFDEAELLMMKNLDKDPGNAYAYYNLGWIRRALHKHELAIEAFEKYLQLAPAGDGDRGRARDAIEELEREVRRAAGTPR